ncbi:MAG: hypothetical protein U0Q12_22885 [Vicinamibacterales bacterium]
MDETITKLAREMAEAIAAAASADPKVEACRQRARAAGYDMRVSIEAVIAFSSRTTTALTKVGPPRASGKHTLDMSANDRRFLRSLRIAVDEPAEEVE